MANRTYSEPCICCEALLMQWSADLFGVRNLSMLADAYFHRFECSGSSIDFYPYTDKPLVAINTASFCGFTPQLYQRYKDQGLEVRLSDGFRQELDDSAETATACYVNYGVTFTMSESQAVSGKNDVIPLFNGLVEQSRQPHWNFLST